jgi:hypothetical protein
MPYWRISEQKLLSFRSASPSRVRRLKKRMNYYDRGIKKAIMVTQRLDSAPPLCTDDEEEGDDYRSMEHSEPIAQVAV